MISEAYNLLAIQAVRLKAKETNTTILSYLTDPGSFCNFVYNNKDNRTSPLYAGLPYCMDRDTLMAKIANNVIQQIELMGQPFSNGNETTGLRLLMGSDLTQFESIVINDPTNLTGQDLTTIMTESRWLMPADISQFDPRCNTTNVMEAEANGCFLVGKFHSCATGCGMDPDTEKLWDDLPEVILGISKDKWNIAGWAVWKEIRGAIGQYSNRTDEETSVDALLFMDNPPADSGATFRFVGMSDRPWFIGKY